MARYPGAIWKPITASKGRRRLTQYNRVNLHVAVTTGTSLHAFFNRSGQVDSHFYVRLDGTVEQYVDTAWQAFADRDGNDATISIETAGGVKNPDSEPWTPAQVESLARLYAWAVRTHGIAKRVAKDSKPGASSRGLSWHRLGIDGNFPALPDVRAGRRQRGGGMHYSKAAGKICPGAGKIRQVPTIYARAVAILDGAKPAPTPKPQPEETDMPSVKEIAEATVKALAAYKLQPYEYDGVKVSAETVFQAIKNTRKAMIMQGRRAGETLTRVRRIEAEVNAQAAALKALAENQGVDGDAVLALVKARLEDAIPDYTVNLTEVQPTSDEEK